MREKTGMHPLNGVDREEAQCVMCETLSITSFFPPQAGPVPAVMREIEPNERAPQIPVPVWSEHPGQEGEQDEAFSALRYLQRLNIRS